MGDRVAIASRNYPEWIFAYWGVIAVGGVVVGMNAWWVADEMAYALSDSEPKLLVADDQRLATFAEIAGDFSDLAVVAVREPSPPVAAVQWVETVSEPGELPMPPIDTNDDPGYEQPLSDDGVGCDGCSAHSDLDANLWWLLCGVSGVQRTSARNPPV